MAKRKLPVVKEPAAGTRGVLVPAPGFTGPVFLGEGPLKLVCGKCGYVLVKGANNLPDTNFVVKCPSCGAYNDLAKQLN